MPKKGLPRRMSAVGKTVGRGSVVFFRVPEAERGYIRGVYPSERATAVWLNDPDNKT